MTHMGGLGSLTVMLLAFAGARAQSEPLAAWNDGPAKQSIISFVTSVTDKSAPTYVAPEDRIATFDQDGTLWVEHPVYAQAMFALDRVHALAPAHPEWKQDAPLNAIIGDNREAIAKFSESDWEKVAAATHAGMSTDAFRDIVRQWLGTATHPRFHRPYTELVYEPMREVMDYLRANGFKVYIVTGGGQEFVRAYAKRVYGVPPEQVIGSSILTKYEEVNGKPVLMREPQAFFIDDHGGKPVGINLFIGKRPYAAFGNSTGDREMLEWTQAGAGARLEMLVLHDDPSREYAYGPARGLPETRVGTFPPALDEEAKKKGWTVVSMKNDWKQVFAFEGASGSSQENSVTAIDIALEPGPTMVQYAMAANARLLKSFPEGFALDETHHPHISILQQFVRTDDLDKVFAAANAVLAKEKPAAWTLKAFKYYYIPSPPIGLAGIVVEPTEDLHRLQNELITAVKPYTVKTGTPAAFFSDEGGRDIQKSLIDYVANFVTVAAGKQFNPHVTIGVGTETYLNKMLADPFVSFTFSAAGASVYQLGSFGSARKELRALPLTP